MIPNFYRIDLPEEKSDTWMMLKKNHEENQIKIIKSMQILNGKKKKKE